MKKIYILTLALAALTRVSTAAPLDFDFKDPKGVNNAVFKLDAPLEAINGSANGITGKIRFDPDAPGSVTGKIIVASESLHVPNPMMKEHLQSPAWLDVAKFPEIVFESKSIKNAHTTGNTTTAEVTGSLTIRGIAKEITVPVKFTYLKDKLGSRVPNLKGDLLVVRAAFPIKRSDYGINPKAPEDKVSDAIELVLSIAGAAPQ